MASTPTSAAVGRTGAWTPGLLALPQSEQRTVQLSVRATWEHIAGRLADHASVARHVRCSVVSLEGMEDAVLIDMVLRHVSAARLKARTTAPSPSHSSAVLRSH